jgi:hypothetical protein
MELNAQPLKQRVRLATDTLRITNRVEFTIYAISILSGFYHVICRDNQRQVIFRTDADRKYTFSCWRWRLHRDPSVISRLYSTYAAAWVEKKEAALLHQLTQ